MNRKFKKSEKFKIYEYSEYAVLLPVDEEYEECMFFFAGFNENASKYIYLLKIFLESLPRLAIKVIIPFLPKYKNDNFHSVLLRDPERHKFFYAWNTLEIINKPEGRTFKVIQNLEKDDQIIKMVNDEIEMLGSSEKIIFVGFSMGGNYSYYILRKMKIKTKFNLMFKSASSDWRNPYKYGTEIQDIAFNENIFYLYYSLYDKVNVYERGVETITNLKSEFRRENVIVRIDNSKKHAVNEECLYYLAMLFKKHKLRPKF